MAGLHGLHHITAIAGPAQENLDFYAGVLGMRLVKRSVNQDDPGTYHLFYADAEGHPGTDLTFFPWEQLAPPRPGHGMAVEVALEVPTDSLDFWGTRLERYGARVKPAETRFGAAVLPVVDPHGLQLALVAADTARGHAFTAWGESPVPPERQIRGLHGARLLERDGAAGEFLTAALGLARGATDQGWTRYAFADGAGTLDIREASDLPRGAWGVGSVHHLAFRVADEQEQLAMRTRILASGARATPVIDRFWFKSIYFHEPGGVLFELATDGPGFAIDEDAGHLGEALVLPPFLEDQRAEIERMLPQLKLPE